MRQLRAMGAESFDVGIGHQAKGMFNRTWSPHELEASMGWLKRENAQGCNIYIRPDKRAPSRLVLIDDLSAVDLARLNAGDHAPALTVQTSPGNWQAWVKFPQAVAPALRHLIARRLAHEYGGDRNSADAVHYGRLAGFTNRKPVHAMADGRFPFVLLDSARGRDAPAAAQLLADATAQLEQERRQHAEVAEMLRQHARSMPEGRGVTTEPERLARWFESLWSTLNARYAGRLDSSRADWMAALEMFRQGHGFLAVAQAVEAHSPGLATRKGVNAAAYVLRTVGRAEVWCELERQGARYADVSHSLGDLARARAQARAASSG